MVAAKILTVATLLFSACSVYSLAVDSALHARHANLGHAFAKRAPVKRCKPRPSSSSPAMNYSNTPATQAGPTPTPSPTPQSSTPSIGNGKAGLAWSLWDSSVSTSTVLANFKLSHVSFLYDWDSSTVPGAADLGYIFIPMMSHSTPDVVGRFNDNVKPGGSYRYVLGFNEPERPEQGNTDPSTACGLYQQYMKPLKAAGIKVGSPAVASSDTGQGWFDTFWSMCQDQVDIVVLHWYGHNPGDFIAYVQKWHDAYQRPIMVTEFACWQFGDSSPDCPNVSDFASKTRAFLDGADYVIGYSPFVMGTQPLGSNILLEGDHPSTLAHTYFD